MINNNLAMALNFDYEYSVIFKLIITNKGTVIQREKCYITILKSYIIHTFA
jgi:hypothetical protein